MAIIKQIDKALNDAVRRTVNKLIVKGRNVASRKVREVYNIKASDLKKHTKIRRATRGSPEAQIIIRGKKIPVFAFGARQTRRGVTIRIKKSGGRKTIEHAFIAQMSSGHTGVFVRVGAKRVPIRELMSISPAKMFELEGERELKKLVERELGSTFKHELDFSLGRI